MEKSRLYIAVLDQFPDYMTPTLVAHAVLGAHLQFHADPGWQAWLTQSFRKCVVRVNQKEFDRICLLDGVYLAHENHTLEGRKSCAVVCPRVEFLEQLPNVLKYAKLWSPQSPAA